LAAATRAASIRLDATADAQPAELPSVRGDDGGPPITVPPAVHRCEGAQRLRIEHERRTLLAPGVDQVADQLRGRQPGPQSGADDEGVVIVIEDPRKRGLGVDLFDVVLRQRHRRRLDDLRGEQWLERLRHGKRDETDARPTRGPTHEQGRSGIVERAGDHQQLAERPLVPTGRSAGQKRDDRLLVELRDPFRPRSLVGLAGGASG
jgi:hypothetical protein